MAQACRKHGAAGECKHSEASARSDGRVSRHTAACAGGEKLGVRVLTCRAWAVGAVEHESRNQSRCGLERSESSRYFDSVSWKYIEVTGRCSAVAKARDRARWSSATLAHVPRTWRV